ncbi:MAG: hypothetical protein R2726_03920 [Acidimicrobiales bacterium]
MSRSAGAQQEGAAVGALSPRLRVVLGAVGLGTGAALVVHILTKVSLALAALVLVVGVVTAFVLVVRRLDERRRADVLHRVRVGAVVGLLATVAYDASRYGFVALLQLSFKPFHAFELFGQAVLGQDAAAPAAFAVGTLYHVANGVGFGIAFAVVVRHPTVWKGIAWAMVLEVSMIALYPSWMQLQAIGELAEVSVVGHVVYGTVLGALTRRWLSVTDSAAVAAGTELRS